MQKLVDKLVELGACSEAIIWAKKQKSLKSAWENCNNFNWLCWLLGCDAGAIAAYNAAVAQAGAAYNAAVAPAWAAYDAIAQAAYDTWAAYDAIVAPAWAAYYAAVAQAKVAYNAAVASISCEFCNKLREIISFEDVLKQGDFYAETY